ncbi:MAG: lysoplasmalogenase [Treponema sp.]
MSAPAIGSLVLFLLVAIFHLTACFYKNPKYADLSKPLLMPFLALTAVLFLLEKGAPTSTIVILTLALALGTAGDVFLLDAKDKRFILGTLSFFIGHIFYLILFIPLTQKMPLWSWAVFAVCATLFTLCSWITINKPKGVKGVFIALYSLILCTIFFCGLSGTLTGYSSAALYVMIGAILFIASDGILSLTLFKKDFHFSRVVIMATYIAAEALLVLGAVAPYLK